MQTTTQLFYTVVNNLFVLCLLCFTVSLLNGCGGGVSNTNAVSETPDVPLTPEEQTEADRIITDTGNNALLHFLLNEKNAKERKDPTLVLSYVKYFVAQGSDVNAKTLNNSTPLFRAVEIENVEAVKFLVSKGANAVAKDTDNHTPFHVAAIMGNIPIAEFLLSKGADVTAPLKWGDTPLHLTVTAGNLDFAKFLVSKGADVHVKNSSGHTPIRLAEINVERPGKTEERKALFEYLSGLQ